MSQYFQIAQAIHDQLSAQPALSDIPIIIDRQKDILNEIQQAISKLGVTITILWQSGDPKEDLTYTTSEYLVRIWAVPILRQAEDIPADDIAEILVQSLQSHNPTPNNPSPHCYNELKIQGGPRLVPNQTFLIYELILEATHSLTPPILTNHQP